MKKTEDMLAPGTQLKGKVAIYEIVSLLGQGGCGITYKAKIPIPGDLQPYYAIKEFFVQGYCRREGDLVVERTDLDRPLNLEAFKARFKREMERLEEYPHPNIVKVSEMIEANNTLYYVMEYLPNGSLEGIREPMDEERAVRYILQIADAVRLIHQGKVNHLDIKPDNIMLDGQDNAVLIDFGIAQGFTQTGDPTNIYHTRGMSEFYSPPEQLNTHNFSPELDIYALGATLYRMVTGQKPPRDLMDVEELPFPGFVTTRMRNFIKRTMQLRPEMRPRNMEVFIDTLDQLYGNGNTQIDTDQDEVAIQKKKEEARRAEEERRKAEKEKEAERERLRIKQEQERLEQQRLQLQRERDEHDRRERLRQEQERKDRERKDRERLIMLGSIAAAVVLILGGFWFMTRPNTPTVATQPIAQTTENMRQQPEATETKQPAETKQTTTTKQAATSAAKPTNNSGTSTASNGSASTRTAVRTTIREPRQSTTTTSSAPTAYEQAKEKEASNMIVTETVTTAPPALSAEELVSKGTSAAKRFNYEQAVRYFTQAAAKGSVVANYHLGDLYYNGNGVDKSFATAKRYFTQAAQKGNANAQYMLGVMYRNGQGGDKDLRQAKAWLQKAANQGHAAAERLLESL